MDAEARRPSACEVLQLAGMWPATGHNKGLQTYIEIDRGAAARLNVTPAGIDTRLYSAFSASALCRPSSRELTCTASCSKCSRNSQAMALMRSSSFTCQAAARSPLTSVAKIVEQNSSAGHQPPIGTSFLPDTIPAPNSAPGASLGDAVKVADRRRTSRRSASPFSVKTGFQGAALAFQASLDQRAMADPRRHRHLRASCSAYFMKATYTW